MKKILIGIFTLTSIVFFNSCKKENLTNLTTEETKVVDNSKSFLKNMNSDALSEFYITGEFDGYRIYCASTLAEYFPSNDTIMNAIYVNNSIGLDNIHLIRENREMTVMIAIYFDKAKIETRQFPYILPRANLAQCEAAQMELINMRKLGTTGQCSPTDDFSFLGHSNRNIKVIVNSFENDIIEGTFEGSLTTMTNSTIGVKNGKFRIKIRRVNS